MPVPVSVTHASGVGLGAEGAAELPTLGPFARLATNKDAAVTTNGNSTANGDSGAPVKEEPTTEPATEDSRGAGAGPVMDAGAAAVETSHLRFTYPGIGECRSGCPSCDSCAVQPVYMETTRKSGKCKGTRFENVPTMQSMLKGCLYRHRIILFPCKQLIHACAPPDGRPQPGASPVVRDMSVSLQPGTRTLLIGANGAGKTTLLKASLMYPVKSCCAPWVRTPASSSAWLLTFASSYAVSCPVVVEDLHEGYKCGV